MEAILSAQITVSLPQIIIALSVSTIVLIFGHARFALFISYYFVLYWSQFWKIYLFAESAVWKLNSPGFLLTGFFIMIVLLSMFGLIFHKE
ncbi:MAG: hypothetical protein NTY16_05560 [Deltaproteobacteria bacterium]|nr:hypothetical protein [Deltaproteobacteria bacterium]